MISQEDVDALFKEFPNIKNNIYWSTWDSIYECRYDDPVFIKLYQKMIDLEIEYDVDHLPDNLKKLWFEINTDLSKDEYSRLKSRSQYVEPHNKKTKQYYSDLNVFFTNRDRLKDAEYCVKGGDTALQKMEDSAKKGLKLLHDSMDNETKDLFLNSLKNYY